MDFFILEDGTDTLPRNDGKGLRLDAALYPRLAQFSSASRRKPEVTENTYVDDYVGLCTSRQV
jgi:hypothetical protein